MSARARIPAIPLRGGVLLLLLLAARAASATTVLFLEEDELCARAQRIFHGICSEARPELDERGRIVTRYRFEVLEDLKGVGAATTEYVQLGGELLGRTLIVPGAARFEEGEEAVVFVGRVSPRSGCAFTVGLAQGKFQVKRDARSGARSVRRDLRGLSFAGTRPADEPGEGLEPFLERMRARVAELPPEGR